MTQEEKQLLLIDLCARLPYGVQCLVNFKNGTQHIMTLKSGLPNSFGMWDFYNKKCSGCSGNFKPYLRPMDSMTEEERKEYKLLAIHCIITSIRFIYLEAAPLIDWLNKNHFNYRLPEHLYIKVTEENNPYKEN